MIFHFPHREAARLGSSWSNRLVTILQKVPLGRCDAGPLSFFVYPGFRLRSTLG